jgi:GTP-binding protein Era
MSKAGWVALIGRPNVGKSTLLNRLLGQKLSIVTRHPQTTRHRIHGIKTLPEGQIVFVDTPGIHAAERRVLNRYMNRVAAGALVGVDVAVWLIDRPAWREEDELVRTKLREAGVPVILAINKVDRIQDKAELLPFLQAADASGEFAGLIPISARDGTQVEVLERRILELLPEREPIYPEDQITDRPERFFAAEMVREKLFLFLGQEVPYAAAVEIEQFQDEEKITRIGAVIWLEKEGQKAIVIGQGGQMLKKIGEAARKDLERFLERKVFLRLWVKVRKGWSDNERTLQSLGCAD